MNKQFNLTKAISAWRDIQVRRREILSEDIDELEVHIRAHVDDLTSKGHTEEIAFYEAIRQIGEVEDLATEYRKVYWGKMKRKRSLMHEIMWKGSIFLYDVRLALRYSVKQKVHTVINVLSLIVAFSCCQLIYLYISHERSYDEQHSEHIYRVTTLSQLPGGDTHWINTPPALAPALGIQYEGTFNVTRLRFAKNVFFSYQELHFYEEKVFYADSSFLEIFNYSMVQGNPNTALDAPNSIVLTESSALKYFGQADPMGQVLYLGDEIPLQVTGIVEPIAPNNHLDFEMLISFPTYEVPEGYLSDLSSWGWVGFHTYVRVGVGANIERLQEEITNEYVQREIPYQAKLQPIRDIYFGSNAMTDAENSPIRSGNKLTSYWLTVIGLLIVVIAAFNLMSTTFGLSIKRLKETGLRKALGGTKRTIISGILLQSILISAVSLLVSSIALIGLFPVTKDVLNWEFSLNVSGLLATSGLALIIALLIGFLAGLYPAIVSVRYSITKALKDQLKLRSNQFAQSIFITIQLAISVGLMFATVIIVRQIDYMRTTALGFEQEQVLVLKVPPDEMAREYSPLHNALLLDPAVQSVAQASRLMGESLGINTMVPGGGNAEDDGIKTAQILVDYDFLETMEIELSAGRFFSRDFAVDSLSTIVINETAANLLGFENPLGERVQFLSDEDREIIGVVKDFHFSSLHSEIGPLALVFTFIDPGNMLVKVSDVKRGVEAVEQIWAQILPDVPLDLSFYDDRMNRLYEKETSLSYLISAFSIVAIVLTVMGLYGIIILIVESRLKELGIRKMLGSSVTALIVLVAKKYLLLTLAALFIGLPLSYTVLRFWLESFSYQTSMSWWIFFGPASLLILLVTMTVFFRILDAARRNPVQVIRMN